MLLSDQFHLILNDRNFKVENRLRRIKEKQNRQLPTRSKFHVPHWFYKLKLSRRLLWAVKKGHIYTTKLGFIKIGHSATLLNKAIFLSCKFPAKLQIWQDSQSVKKAKTAVNLMDHSVSIIQKRLAFHSKARRQIQWHQN